MAITYKSQGAGVSTETSGAALSPLCPATVDAGDILIAHVFWEGTTTAPSTPGGWELLGSSPYVIETTIARHWVFGKIAAGTEDGSAVAFGSPAVTTQRAARIYSFAGRVAGTILELVTGFAHLSHATDPQMPTVTTTLAGALAVALVAQNDNNAFADPTGESNGNWVRAVTEYTVALTPGFSIGICTATPTGDPGTISGGSMATTNDPCGVIAFQIKQSNNQNVDAGLGQVDVAGFAPTVVATNNIIVNALLGALLLTGFEPTVVASDHKIVSPDFGQVLITGFEPTIGVGSGVNPDFGQVLLTGFEPAVSVSDHKVVLLGVGAVTLDGFSPTVQTPRVVLSDFGEIALNGFSPTIVTSDHKLVLPGLGQILVDGFEPSVNAGAGLSVNPGSGQVVLDGFVPAVVASDYKIIFPDVGGLVLSGFEPTVVASDHKIVTPDSAQLQLSSFEPVVVASNHQVVLVGFGEIVFGGFAPSLGGQNIEIEPGVGQLIFDGYGPNVASLPPGGIIAIALSGQHLVVVLSQGSEHSSSASSGSAHDLIISNRVGVSHVIQYENL